MGQIFADLEYFLFLYGCASPSMLNNSFRPEKEAVFFLTLCNCHNSMVSLQS